MPQRLDGAAEILAGTAKNCISNLLQAAGFAV
jgi:hypothetical protein